jgi:hypothetical protein
MKDIGDVRSSSTVGKKGSSYQQQRIVQNAMGLTTTTTHLREFASMAEDLQPGITMNSTIYRSKSTIGWGTRPASTIGWGKASVHDWLGGRVNKESNNRLEEMTNSLSPDEDIMCRAPER